MKYPMEKHYVFHIELLSELVDDIYSNLFSADFPSLSNFDDTYYCDSCIDTNLCFVCAEIEVALQVDTFPADEVIDEAFYAAEALDIPTIPTKPSIEQPPFLELKPLPDNLKYAFLERNEKLQVIISANFNFGLEDKLLQVLRKHKKAIR